MGPSFSYLRPLADRQLPIIGLFLSLLAVLLPVRSIGQALTFSETSRTIVADETWSTPRTVTGTIRIQRGATLTIKTTTVEFDDTKRLTGSVLTVPPTRIVVEVGAMLYVDRALLTTLAAAGIQMWDGIQVMGDPENTQTTL